MEKIDDGGDDYSASTASFSPSFSTYSGDRLAEIAARVVRDDYKEKENEEFEFAILQAASSSGDDDGGLVFPVFDQTLLSAAVEREDVSPEAVVTPLKDLLLRERNDQPPPPPTYSSSSDDEEEEDDLDTIPSEMYCPWTPARSAAEMSPSGGCRKSKSTGSSSTPSWSKKRWRIKDLLKRSRSDGKQSLEFVDSSNKRDESSSSPSPKTMTVKKKEKEKVSAHERFYLRNKAMKEEDKKRSYLPYKQDLVGLFSNVSRFSKTFPPF